MQILRSTGNLKRVTLELGGKSPNIIFADSDLKAAINAAVGSFCALSGQRCIAGTRILVQREVYDEVVHRIAALADDYLVGDPWDPDTLMGPLVSQVQFDRVSKYFDIARRDRARLVTGGPSAKGTGYFIRPTVYADVDNSMRVAREEIFGPVACVLPFLNEQDAVRQANDTEFGLAAAVWTKDFARAHRMARQLKAGSVGINRYPGSDPTAPFGGYKQSGIGHELGAASIDSYTQLKAVFADVS
jgi:phenylacetaldehyde dehydrogenase